MQSCGSDLLADGAIAVDGVARRLAAVACAFGLAFTAADTRAQLAMQVVAEGVSRPVGVVQDPVRSGVQYIVEQGGTIRVLADGALLSAPLLDLGRQVSTGGERGLLGLAFPPDYATSHRFFVNFTNTDGHTVVARFRHLPDNPLVADLVSRVDLRWPDGRRFIVQPYANHNGGKLLFRQDGYLYVGMGDGGSANDPQNHAQDPTSLLGKLLRLDVAVPDDDPDGYRVPSDNPFVAGRGPVGALGEIWAFGLRNPWRFSEDLAALGGTGALVIADVGQGAREEIDYEPVGAAGRNYGWRFVEGTRPNVQSPPPAYGPLQPPIFEYGRDDGGSITGGVVYRGNALPAPYRGRYFFADFVSRRLWSLGLDVDPDSGEARVVDRQEHTSELGGTNALGVITSIDTDAHGEVYLADWLGGRVLKIVTAERDDDGDGLPDRWERQFGLDPASGGGPDGPGGDPDADGLTNAQELQAGSHPRGFVRYHLAEGAASGFFSVVFAVANANDAPAHVLLSLDRIDGRRVGRHLVVPPRGHARVDTANDADLVDTSFGLLAESDAEVAIDRTMRWGDAVGEYGAHAETATAQLSATWYFAEGATHSGFNLFYLLANPGTSAADATITYLRPAPAPPLVRTYRVLPRTRYTVWVNQEDPGLAATDVAAWIATLPSTPLVVERAMYLDRGTRTFEAGHAALGARAPAPRWYFAEAATGDFFDTFLLLANPGEHDAVVRVEFLLPDGSRVERRSIVVQALSRLTIWVDAEDPRLAATAVSAIVESQNDVPVVAERSMWWPGPSWPTWHEAHGSLGVTAPAANWLVAGGESGGSRRASTWLLVANAGPTPATADVTVLFADRPPVSRPVAVAAASRFGTEVSALVPEAANRAYGVVVAAREPGAALVVERSTYWDAGGAFWAAGVNASGLPLR